MNLRRNNHYLAQCYQEGFTDDTGRVWFKECGKPPEHRNPRSVGKKRNLYIRKHVNGTQDDRIEEFFSSTVETSFASLSQRIKNERDKFAKITVAEKAALLHFVASQTVRTLGHRSSVDVQAGRSVDQNVFLDVMLQQMRTIVRAWAETAPMLRFFCTLPYVGEYFISGDHPVLVMRVSDDDPLWLPIEEPMAGITPLQDILRSSRYAFSLPLSPYVCVSVQPQDRVSTDLPLVPMEPPQVRMLNRLLRGQSRLFTLARDRESLN